MTAASAVAGCTGFLGDDEVTVQVNGDEQSFPAGEVANYWHDFADGEQEDFESYVGEFNGLGDAKVNESAVAKLQERLTTAIPAGDGPHAFGWAHDWLGNFEGRDFLYDASDDLNVDLGVYQETGQNAVTWDGGVYGLPYASETVTLMVNTELTDVLPETVDEMVDVMEDFHDPDAGQYGLSYPVDAYFVSAWLHAFGGFYFDDDEGLGVDSPEVAEGLEFLVDNLWEYQPQDPDYGTQASVFADGNAPFAINGPWELGSFRGDIGEENLEVLTLPTIDGDNAPAPYSGIQMWYFADAMNEATDEQLESAIEFAEWYTTNENVIVSNANNHGFIPIHAEFEDSDELDPAVEAYAGSVAMGTPMPADDRMDQVWEPTEDAIIRVLNGEQGAQESLDEAAETIRSNWE